MRAQLLDSMDLERERGITIKAQAVRVFYEAKNGETYQLHLIDTPGHVDFTYEVSRSLAACEGALLVVDASQGVEAQTVANTYLAVDSGLELIPTLNKIDLPGAEPERVAEEIADLIGEDPHEVRRISAKTGEGVADVLEELVARVPPPHGDPDAAPRALIFDSEYDQYRGVIAYIRVVDGTFTKGEAIAAMAAGTQADVDDIGFFTPAMTPAEKLSAGEVGYLITGIKDVGSLPVGDTLTTRANPASEALPGYRDVKPMVFCGLFPIESNQFEELRDALEKLSLNDAALFWEPENSDALGFGFRCGFLGLLHMDIVRERLEREYDVDLMATMPSVEFEITLTDGSELTVHNPSDMPDPARIDEVREPMVRASILAPKEHIGQIMELCQERRGEHQGMHFLSAERVQVTYDLPLAEIVLDFFDQLKSRTRGYASLDYEPIGMQPSDMVKLDVLLAGDPVDALSMIVHRDKAYEAGRGLVDRLRKRIPRQQYDVPIQAAVGAKIIARETVKAFRKDVTAKCYGGDISRKRKLLERQKEGKRRMKQVGRIEVPQDAFLAVLELDGDSQASERQRRLGRGWVRARRDFRKPSCLAIGYRWQGRTPGGIPPRRPEPQPYPAAVDYGRRARRVREIRPGHVVLRRLDRGRDVVPVVVLRLVRRRWRVLALARRVVGRDRDLGRGRLGRRRRLWRRGRLRRRARVGGGARLGRDRRLRRGGGLGGGGGLGCRLRRGRGRGRRPGAGTTGLTRRARGDRPLGRRDVRVVGRQRGRHRPVGVGDRNRSGDGRGGGGERDHRRGQHGRRGAHARPALSDWGRGTVATEAAARGVAAARLAAAGGAGRRAARRRRAVELGERVARRLQRIVVGGARPAAGRLALDLRARLGVGRAELDVALAIANQPVRPVSEIHEGIDQRHQQQRHRDQPTENVEGREHLQAPAHV